MFCAGRLVSSLGRKRLRPASERVELREREREEKREKRETAVRAVYVTRETLEEKRKGWIVEDRISRSLPVSLASRDPFEYGPCNDIYKPR